jgi:hypothetical protein
VKNTFGCRRASWAEEDTCPGKRELGFSFQNQNIFFVSRNIITEKEKIMKKIFVLVLSLSLVAGIASSVFAAPARKVVKPTPRKITPVKPSPVAPDSVVPAPAAVVPAPAKAGSDASKGMGLSVGAKAGLTAGVPAITADMEYSLDSWIKGAAARLSLDYVTGNNPNSAAAIDNPMKAVDVKLGGTYALDFLKNPALPVDWYTGAAYIIPVRVDGGRSGGWGAEAFLGAKRNITDMGKIYGELGYAGLKYASTAPALKGISAALGYMHSF